MTNGLLRVNQYEAKRGSRGELLLYSIVVDTSRREQRKRPVQSEVSAIATWRSGGYEEDMNNE